MYFRKDLLPLLNRRVRAVQADGTLVLGRMEVVNHSCINILGDDGINHVLAFGLLREVTIL
jgi:hypothetical protein